jgi:type VI protein secretion system component Hcp
MANATLLMNLQGPKGRIEGESTIEGYEGFIEIESLQWSLDVEGARPTPSALSFTKFTDRATVPMLELLRSCKDALSAEILVEEDSTDSDLELKLRLTKVRFTSCALSGKVDEKSGAMEERWSARADKLRMDYRSAAGRASIPFEVVFDPRVQAKSPQEKVEAEIIELAADLRAERLKPLFAKMEQAVAQRKKEREAPGDKKEDRAVSK